jgi:Ni,Fe-hydrogenase III large subunit/Ni,Fe-hydrogenase III component G
MPVSRWFESARELPGAPGVRGVVVDRAGWRRVAEDLAAASGRLLALWGDRSDTGEQAVCALLLAPAGALVVVLPLGAQPAAYPSIGDIYPSAVRLERAAFDLSGVRSTGDDTRAWLRHAAWPAGFHPLAGSPVPAPVSPPPADDYAFVRVEGEGVHEVAVGPVHAGIIEPGHFRFSIVGEKVLRLEEHLGYVHKGIERRFTELPLLEGHRLAARVSGDSAVAFSWAYCQALEGMAGVSVPPRAAAIRALGLELERLANHLGDLGALGNDAGFAFGLAQFSRLKELLLRAGERALGQRYLLDLVVPGGTRVDVAGAGELAAHVRSLADEVHTLREIYDEHAGVRDRFAGAGTVEPELAARLGLVGLAGRASGQALDLRVDLPCEPYGALAPKKCGEGGGDVLARVAVRFDELFESCRLVEAIVVSLPAGEHAVTVPVPAAGSFGVGLIEGWRGPGVVTLEAGADGRIARCHPQDPSWHNWPVLEHAIIGNIVPDFPLINKSFNLSYSGHDL